MRTVSILELMKAAPPRKAKGQPAAAMATTTAPQAWATPAPRAASLESSSGDGTSLKAILAEQAAEEKLRAAARSQRLSHSPGSNGKWGVTPAPASGAWMLDAPPIESMAKILADEVDADRQQAEEAETAAAIAAVAAFEAQEQEQALAREQSRQKQGMRRRGQMRQQRPAPQPPPQLQPQPQPQSHHPSSGVSGRSESRPEGRPRRPRPRH
jgi:hypothetical protein